MKILQISNYYEPHIGGIEQVAKDIANVFEKMENVSHKVFCFNHEKENRIDNVNGVQVVRAGSFIKVASQSLSFSYGKILRKTLKEFVPDVIIFHYPNPFGAMHLLKYLKKHPNVKLVLYWHLDITKQKILGKLFNMQNKKLLARACKVVATSPNYKNESQYLQTVSQKCEVIPNCVAPERLILDSSVNEYVCKIKENNKNKTICFALGRHVPYKGLEYLVKASKYLDESFAIYIAGSGPLTDELKKLAADDKKVNFLGRISDAELKAYLSSCDIFCFPSITKNEAFGIALAEAMAYSKPSVTFTIPCSGVNYVSIDKETGIEVENGNVVAYANAIKQLAKDESLRQLYGAKAKQRYLDNFTTEQFVQNIKELINSLVDNQ